jgi:hypothetical protein
MNARRGLLMQRRIGYVRCEVQPRCEEANTMQKFAVAVIASAAILCVASWSSSQAGGIQPGYYAYSQFVYGSTEQRYAEGCLRWVWPNRSWYNYCTGGQYVVARRKVIAVRY